LRRRVANNPDTAVFAGRVFGGADGGRRAPASAGCVGDGASMLHLEVSSRVCVPQSRERRFTRLRAASVFRSRQDGRRAVVEV
jgi:hypothetical protein